MLGFYPRDVPLTKNPFHSLEVRTKSPDLRVSARNGYYGEAEGGGGVAVPDFGNARNEPPRNGRRIEYATTRENPRAPRSRRLRKPSTSNS